MDIKNTTDPKYYNWLLYSVGASFILFGGFVFLKKGDMTLLFAILIEWAISGLIGSVIWSLIVAGIARVMKRNYKNAFLGSFSIMIFVFACITIAQVSTRL